MESKEGQNLKLVETVEIEVTLDEDTAKVLEYVASDTGLSVDRIVEHALLDKFIRESMEDYHKAPEKTTKPPVVEEKPKVWLDCVWKQESLDLESGDVRRLISLSHPDSEAFDMVVTKEMYDFFTVGDKYLFLLDDYAPKQVTVKPESEWPEELQTPVG